MFLRLLDPTRWRRRKFLRNIIEFLLNFAPQHLRFPQPHGVEAVVLQSAPPRKVEEKKISLQTYRIFLNSAPQHLRFPLPNVVKEAVFQSPSPNKVEEKKISLQNFLIFAEFRAASLAISFTSWG